MKVDEKVIPYAMSYVRIIALYLPLYAIDSSLQAALQAFGITKPIMYVGLIKVLLNLLVDWILIFGKFGFPAMGIEDAALATLASNIVVSVALIIYFYSTESLPMPMKITEIVGFNKKVYFKIVKIGLPTGLEFFLWFVDNLVLITLLNTLESNGVAVYVLTSSIGVLVFMIYISFARATMTLISQCIGAQDFHIIPKIMNRSVVYNILVVTFFIVIVLIFQRPFLDIFTNDLELMNLTIPMMGYLLFTIYPKSMNVLIGHGIRALGKTSWMLYTQIVGTIFVITVSFVLVKFFDLGLEAIFITVLGDEVFRSVINTWYFVYQTRTTRIMNHQVL